MTDEAHNTETGSVEVSRVIKAPAERIYKAFLDADALAKWSPPGGYTATYDHVDARIGGRFHGTFTSLDKSESHGFGGEYKELVPYERIVHTDKFDGDDPDMQSEMTVTVTFEAVAGGTKVTVRQEGIPKVVPTKDAEIGWGMSMENLARLVEYPEAPGG